MERGFSVRAAPLSILPDLADRERRDGGAEGGLAAAELEVQKQRILGGS